jgi:TrmH family RNA methyltransferase
MEPEGVLVIGNEGKGISEEVLPYLSHRISIPRIGGAESLNAAVACGILVAKWNRL